MTRQVVVKRPPGTLSWIPTPSAAPCAGGTTWIVLSLTTVQLVEEELQSIRGSEPKRNPLIDEKPLPWIVTMPLGPPSYVPPDVGPKRGVTLLMLAVGKRNASACRGDVPLG